MKGIILATLGILFASHSFAGEQAMNTELAQEISQNCSFIQITYFDIDNDELEPVELEASEEACYRSLKKLIQEDRLLLLSEEQLYWFDDMALYFNSLIDDPAIDDNFTDRPDFDSTEEESGEEDITGRIVIVDDYEDDERPDFN